MLFVVLLTNSMNSLSSLQTKPVSRLEREQRGFQSIKLPQKSFLLTQSSVFRVDWPIYFNMDGKYLTLGGGKMNWEWLRVNLKQTSTPACE